MHSMHKGMKMKKLTTLLLAAGLVVSSFAGASSASAVEVKPFGSFTTEFAGYSGHPAGVENSGLGYDYNLDASYRFRLGLDMVASENLSATVLFQFGEYAYGTAAPGETYATEVGLRLMYLDWVVPNTDVQVRMGRHDFTLPSYAFGSPIIDDFADGITVATDINENLAVSAMWIRPEINASYAGTPVGDNDGDANTPPTSIAAYHNDRGIIVDAFGIASEYVGEGFAVAPYALYQVSGKNTSTALDNGAVDALWLGLGFELSMFDPFTFALDAFYKNVDSDALNESESFYYVATKVAYATEFGVPSLGAWYASGVDLNDAKEKGFVGTGGGIAAAFGASSVLFDDNDIGTRTNDFGGDPQGKMGVVFEWAEISFIENVNHIFRVMYVEGTNDSDGVVGDWSKMTDDDSAVEVNFNTAYQMYESLSVSLDLGWVAPDFKGGDSDGINDDIYRAALNFTYAF